jgi:hypothetical protein
MADQISKSEMQEAMRQKLTIIGRDRSGKNQKELSRSHDGQSFIVALLPAGKHVQDGEETKFTDQEQAREYYNSL